MSDFKIYDGQFNEILYLCNFRLAQRARRTKRVLLRWWRILRSQNFRRSNEHEPGCEENKLFEAGAIDSDDSRQCTSLPKLDLNSNGLFIQNKQGIREKPFRKLINLYIFDFLEKVHFRNKKRETNY